MEKQPLIKRFYQYISKHHPDLLRRLQQQTEVTDFLSKQIETLEVRLASLQEAKVAAYAIEAACFNELVEALGADRYHYVANVLEAEHHSVFHELTDNGLLIYEVINLMALCVPVFERLPIPKDPNENDRGLYQAVTEVITAYLYQH